MASEKRHKRDDVWVRQLTLADPEEPGLAGPTIKGSSDGASIIITNRAGTATTLNATELGFTDGVTAGTVTASKALVVDANKDLASLRHLTLTGNLVTGATTLSETELAYLDGLTTGTVTASKALVVDANKDLASLRHLTLAGNLLTSANVGTANTGTTAAEYGDARNHVTVLTVSTTLPAIAGGANLAVGKLLYTMPAGACVIHAAKMSLAITQTQGNITADTPDGGLGSVIGSGVVATLDGTATFEDILTGQTFNDCNGTAEVKTVANQPMVMETGAAHTVHFNVADGWAASGDAAALLAGTVILHWVFLG